VSHGAQVKAGHASDRAPKVGDVVDFFNMSLSLKANDNRGPGPYEALVVSVTSRTRLDLSVDRGALGKRMELDVDHRSAADGPRLWAFRP